MKYLMIILLCLVLTGCGAFGKDNSIEAHARAYITRDLRADWDIIECDQRPDIYRQHPNHSKVWIKVGNIRREPWDNEWTCGYLWYDKNGNLVKNKMVTDEYRK